MTPAHYLVARIARTFGLHRKTKRMSDAASEMHLLREAEAILGYQIWPKIAEVEELAVEYWNLRKLTQERESIRTRLTECEHQLAAAHDERSALLGQASEPHHELLARRSAAIAELESLARQRDDILNQARSVKRAFEGAKMKLEVLSKDASHPQAELDATRARLHALKAQFSELKQRRTEIADRIEAGDRALDRVDHELSDRRHHRREQAAEAFQIIADANREISIHRAELSLQETQIHQLYSDIGRYVSRHAYANPVCTKAAKDHRALIDVMGALRRSVALNHLLADQA